MLATIKAKYVSSYFKAFDFEAKDGKPASHFECYRLVLKDDDAFFEKDQFFTITVPMALATKLGMDKPSFEKDNLGKLLTCEGILTTKKDQTNFQLEKLV